MKLDIGCGENKHEGYIGIDKRELPGVNLVIDLDNDWIPLPDNSVERIIAHNVLEHLECPYRVVQEMIRISMDGAIWDVRFPNPEHPNAWKDPEHKYILTPEFFDRFPELEVVKVMKHHPSRAPRLNWLADHLKISWLRGFVFDEYRIIIRVRKNAHGD